tara:strand:- start:2144 stop:2281 length:138 start_codon:yes stop_codon:yes gene_type:complete
VKTWVISGEDFEGLIGESRSEKVVNEIVLWEEGRASGKKCINARS